MTNFRDCNLYLYTNLDNVVHEHVITQLEDFVFENYKLNKYNSILSQNVRQIRKLTYLYSD